VFDGQKRLQRTKNVTLSLQRAQKESYIGLQRI